MKMTQVLVLVKNNNGISRNYYLFLNHTLKQIRETLTGEGFMFRDDDFMSNDAPVAKKDEEEVQLYELVGQDNLLPLHIGKYQTGLDSQDTSLERYNGLNLAQKIALFKEIEIFRGLTASYQEGFRKTFKPCITEWTKEEQLPDSVRPTYVSEVTVQSSFNEVTHSMVVSSINKASASLNIPFGGGQAEFEHAQRTATTSNEVTQYFAGKFFVTKVLLNVDINNLELVPDFTEQVLTAVQKGTNIDQYANLINTLNERGYFVPKSFRLGGSLLNRASTKVSKFSQSQSEQQEFAVGFRLTIKGFGGGADYSNSSGSDQSSSTTSRYSDLTIEMIGGQAHANDYKSWALSLNPAINWDVITYDQLYPTIALLKNKSLIRHCLYLMNEYNTYPTVQDKQRAISIAKYATQVETILFNS
jgi:hypothetical protein